MIIGRYLAGRFLRAFALVGGVLVLVLGLIDIVEQIRRHGDMGIGLGGAARLAALNLPAAFYNILPLVILLSAVVMFMSLARNSELTAIRAAGRSDLRMVVAPAVMALLLGAGAVMILNPMAAASKRALDEAVATMGGGARLRFNVELGAVWLRQPELSPTGAPSLFDSGQIVIRAAGASGDGSILHQADFLITRPESGPVTRYQAQSAALSPGEWMLSNVTEWPLDAPNPEAARRHYNSLSIPTDLTLARIHDGVGDPATLAIWQLPAFIEGLNRAGFSALRYRVWFQNQLALPLMLAAMVFVAAPFTMKPTRGRKVGGAVLWALAGGVALFFLRNIAQAMGDSGALTPVLAAWGPPVIAILFALGYLLALEDGKSHPR